MIHRRLLHSGASLLSILLILSLLVMPVSALSASELDCEAAIVIDAGNGEPLFEKNADTQLVPASMTKVMAIYVVYDAIDAGQFTESSVVPIDSAVSAFSMNGNYSNVPLYTSVTYTVSELIDAVVLSSACAATQALAMFVSGTEEAFVETMNATAAQLDLDCEFHDSYGGSPNNRITARSMALLCKHLIENHPQYLSHSNKNHYTFHGYTYYNTNVFVRGTYSCSGTVDGIKTGFTTPAGHCFATTAYNDDHRVITVVMKAPSSTTRNKIAGKLMDYGLEVLANRPPCVYPFSDVLTSVWYADAVSCVYENGIMNGTSSYSFEPETVLTRAMMARILYNLEGQPDMSSDTEPAFTDVEAGTWYYHAVEWAESVGLVHGRGEGIFAPTDAISRQEMVTMLYRYENYKGGDTSARADLWFYDDQDSIGDFALDAMEWAVAEGIVQGSGNSLLSPLGAADRAQIAQVMTNYIS